MSAGSAVVEVEVVDVAIRHHAFHAPLENAGEQAGKQLAMFMFNVGGRSLEATQRAFNDHPGWRGA